MTARIIPFPPRGPFAVRVEREGAAWLVVCRDHGWLHGDERQAVAEANALARGFNCHCIWKPEERLPPRSSTI